MCAYRLLATMHSNRNTRSNTRTVFQEDTVIDQQQFEKLSSNEKIIVSILSSKIDELNSKFTAALKERDEKIEHLEKEVSNVKTAYKRLEDKFDDYEALSRGNSIIVSGSETPISNKNEDCAEMVRNLIKNKLSYSMNNQTVTSAYRIGTPPPSQKPDRRSILVTLDNENTAQTLVKTSKLVKPTNLYFSENLIQKRHTILQVLRKLKKDHPSKISGCSSIRGKIYAWIKPPNADMPSARNTRILVNTHQQLEDFCVKVVEIPFESVDVANSFL